MRLLNDAQTEQKRLAYLLGGNVELYRRTGYWSGALLGVVFLAATALVVLWYFSQFSTVSQHPHHEAMKVDSMQLSSP